MQIAIFKTPYFECMHNASICTVQYVKNNKKNVKFICIVSEEFVW